MPKMFYLILIFTLAILSQISDHIYAAEQGQCNEFCQIADCNKPNATNLCPEECQAPALWPRHFRGYCRFGAATAMKNQIEAITVTSPLRCQQHCIGTTGCVAFSYDNSGTNNCNIYEGGPYEYGNERRGTTCYAMPVTPDCASDQDCPGIGEKCFNPGAHNAKCELVEYYGQCNDENGSASVLGRRDISDLPDCREKCRKNPKCVAFSYERENQYRYNCYRFQGGPYVSGTGSHKRCYILRPTCKDKIEACQTAQLDCEQDFVKTNCQKHCNLCPS